MPQPTYELSVRLSAEFTNDAISCESSHCWTGKALDKRVSVCAYWSKERFEGHRDTIVMLPLKGQMKVAMLYIQYLKDLPIESYCY